MEGANALAQRAARQQRRLGVAGQEASQAVHGAVYQLHPDAPGPGEQHGGGPALQERPFLHPSLLPVRVLHPVHRGLLGERHAFRGRPQSDPGPRGRAAEPAGHQRGAAAAAPEPQGGEEGPRPQEGVVGERGQQNLHHGGRQDHLEADDRVQEEETAAQPARLPQRGQGGEEGRGAGRQGPRLPAAPAAPAPDGPGADAALLQRRPGAAAPGEEAPLRLHRQLTQCLRKGRGSADPGGSPLPGGCKGLRPAMPAAGYVPGIHVSPPQDVSECSLSLHYILMKLKSYSQITSEILFMGYNRYAIEN